MVMFQPFKKETNKGTLIMGYIGVTQTLDRVQERYCFHKRLHKLGSLESSSTNDSVEISPATWKSSKPAK